MAIYRCTQFAQGSYPSYSKIISDRKTNCENKNYIKSTHSFLHTVLSRLLCYLCFLPPHTQAHTRAHIHIFFLNNLRVSYIHCGPFLLNSSPGLFPKNRDTVLHNHHSVINFSNFNIDKVFYLIYHLCSNFVSWPNNVLWIPLFSLPI